VGFYGSDQYLKSYTALGEVVNLASRLCSSAAVNQIAVSEEVASRIGESFTVRQIGAVALKGFEQPVVMFEIQEPESSEGPLDIEICPSGHGVLHLDVTSEGIHVFKCRTCGYTLDQLGGKPVEPSGVHRNQLRRRA
jgi:hypothetical protein